MRQLVMKDMRLIGIANLVILGIGIFSGFVGIFGFEDKIIESNYFYGVAIIATWFIVNTLIATKEFESNPDSLILSLPVKKFDIVKSRYLTLTIYIFGTLGIIYLTSNIVKVLFNNMSGESLDLLGILVIGAIMIIFTSVYIPFQYYDQKSAQFFPAIIQVLAVSSPNIIKRFNINIDGSTFIRKILAADFNLLAIILLGVSLILYMISLFISKKIYEAQEF